MAKDMGMGGDLGGLCNYGDASAAGCGKGMVCVPEWMLWQACKGGNAFGGMPPCGKGAMMKGNPAGWQTGKEQSQFDNGVVATDSLGMCGDMVSQVPAMDQQAQYTANIASMKVANGEVVHSGFVRSWTPSQKYGFVCCETAGELYSQDIYIFGDVLVKSKAGPGDIMIFFVHRSKKGNPQVSSPLLRIVNKDGYALRGTYEPGPEGTDFGMIVCPELNVFFGRDCYCDKEFASQLLPGQSVMFNVALDEQGMPTVKNLDTCGEDWEALPADLSQQVALDNHLKGKGGGKGFDGCGSGFAGGFGKGCFSNPMQQQQQQQQKGGCGFGNQFQNQFAGCGGGCGGCFGGNGMQCGSMNANFGAMPQQCMMGNNMMMGKGNAANFAAPQPTMPSACNALALHSSDLGGDDIHSKTAPTGFNKPATPTGQVLVGTIKSFNNDNGYGFITCDEVRMTYKSDVFVSNLAIGSFAPGDAVMFDLGISEKGQPVAMNLRPAGGNVGDMWGGEPDAKRRCI